MKRVIYIIFGILGFILLLGVFLFYLLVASPTKHKKIQDEYFSKVDYQLSGEIKRFEHLGGGNCLLYIYVNEFKMHNNFLSHEDDFVGLYDRDNRSVVFFANFNPIIGRWYQPGKDDKIGEVKDVDISVDSEKRKIYYKQKTHIDTTFLMPTRIYKSYLVEKEKELLTVVRF